MGDPADLDTPTLRSELARMRQEHLDLMAGKQTDEEQHRVAELDARIHRFTLEYIERGKAGKL